MEQVSFTDRTGTYTMFRIVNEDGSMVWYTNDHPVVLAWLAEGNTPEPWEAPVAD